MSQLPNNKFTLSKMIRDLPNGSQYNHWQLISNSYTVVSLQELYRQLTAPVVSFTPIVTPAVRNPTLIVNTNGTIGCQEARNIVSGLKLNPAQQYTVACKNLSTGSIATQYLNYGEVDDEHSFTINRNLKSKLNLNWVVDPDESKHYQILPYKFDKKGYQRRRRGQSALDFVTCAPFQIKIIPFPSSDTPPAAAFDSTAIDVNCYYKIVKSHVKKSARSHWEKILPTEGATVENVKAMCTESKFNTTFLDVCGNTWLDITVSKKEKRFVFVHHNQHVELAKNKNMHLMPTSHQFKTSGELEELASQLTCRRVIRHQDGSVMSIFDASNGTVYKSVDHVFFNAADYKANAKLVDLPSYTLVSRITKNFIKRYQLVPSRDWNQDIANAVRSADHGALLWTNPKYVGRLNQEEMLSVAQLGDEIIIETSTHGDLSSSINFTGTAYCYDQSGSFSNYINNPLYQKYYMPRDPTHYFRVSPTNESQLLELISTTGWSRVSNISHMHQALISLGWLSEGIFMPNVELWKFFTAGYA